MPIFSATSDTSQSTSVTSVHHVVSARTHRALVGMLTLILLLATSTAVFSALNSGPTHSENRLSLPVDAAAQVTMNNQASWCWSAEECALATTLSPGDIPALYFTSGSRVVRSPAALPTYQGHHVIVSGLWCDRIAHCWAAGTASVGRSTYAVTSRLLGNTWRTTTFPLPPNAAGGATTDGGTSNTPGAPVTAALNGLSCTSPTSCVAVGTYEDSNFNTLGLVVIYDGSAWISQDVTLPPNANYGPDPTSENSQSWQTTYLTGVSCGDGQHCAIIGSYTSTSMPSTVNSIPLIIDDEGSTLTARAAPLPYASALEDQAKLTSVACVGAHWCTIVGATSPNALYANSTFAIVKSSEAWRAQMLTGATSSATQALPSIGTASSPINCWAVDHCAMTGSYGDPMIVHLRGTTVTSLENIPTWSGRGGPLSGTILGSRLYQTNSTSSFTNLSCSSATSCTMFASSDDGSNQGRPTLFLERQGHWRGADIPVAGVQMAPARSGLRGVACSTFGCVAVGNYERTTGEYPWASLFAHGRWTSEPVPLPTDASVGQTSSLESVWCAHTGECVAVGYYWTRDGVIVPLAEVRRDGSWTPTAPFGNWRVQSSVTSPALHRVLQSQPFGVIPFTVRCETLHRCFAGGVDYDSSQTALFFFDGEAWTRVTVDLPKGAVATPGDLGSPWNYHTPYVSGIDCATSSKDCTFVGGYTTAGGDRMWVASGDGATSLHANDLFALSHQAATSGEATSLACTSGDCVVPVGLVSNSQDVAPAYFVRHDGVWSFHLQRGLRSTLLNDVSCPAFAPCQIIGQGSHGVVARLTLHGDEPHLTHVTPLRQFFWPGPVLPEQQWTFLSISGVSCAPAGYCAIVGTQGATGVVTVLAPR